MDQRFAFMYLNINVSTMEVGMTKFYNKITLREIGRYAKKISNEKA